MNVSDYSVEGIIASFRICKYEERPLSHIRLCNFGSQLTPSMRGARFVGRPLNAEVVCRFRSGFYLFKRELYFSNASNIQSIVGYSAFETQSKWFNSSSEITFN
jgi:hypothetical protein